MVDYLYWSDWVLLSILRANKNNGEDVIVLRKDIPKPMGIVAVSNQTFTCKLIYLNELNNNSRWRKLSWQLGMRFWFRCNESLSNWKRGVRWAMHSGLKSKCQLQLLREQNVNWWGTLRLWAQRINLRPENWLSLRIWWSGSLCPLLQRNQQLSRWETWEPCSDQLVESGLAFSLEF